VDFDWPNSPRLDRRRTGRRGRREEPQRLRGPAEGDWGDGEWLGEGLGDRKRGSVDIDCAVDWEERV
jgi:hypothetical protein